MAPWTAGLFSFSVAQGAVRTATATLPCVSANECPTSWRRAHGRIEGRKGAAALLEINPHTLRAKMRKLGIDWTRFREAE